MLVAEDVMRISSGLCCSAFPSSLRHTNARRYEGSERSILGVLQRPVACTQRLREVLESDELPV